MLIALDTNVLVYFSALSHGPDDDLKVAAAQTTLAALSEKADVRIPVQAYGELYTVALRFGRSREVARALVEKLRREFGSIGSDDETLGIALDLATEHKLQFWDALILSAAADAGCSLLLSEDLQAGFTWRGVRVVDPFAKKMDVRLKRVMGGD
jgi:predicted nucleic acid-binding protein